MDDENMASIPGLNRRKNGVWYLRVRVPKHLAQLHGAPDIRESFKTKDRMIARKAFRKRIGEIEGYFEELEGRLKGLDRVDRARTTGDLGLLRRADIEGLVREWWIRRTESRSGEEPLLPHSPADIDELREVDRHLTEDEISRIADRLLTEAGVISAPHTVGSIKTRAEYPRVDRTSQKYRDLLDLVERGLRIEEQLALDAAAGQRKASYDPLFNPLGDRSGPNGLRGPKNVEDLIRAFRAEREMQHGEESTARKYDLLCRALREIWGPDLPVREIDRVKVIEVRQHLEALPPNSMKRFPKLTIMEAIDAGKKAGLQGLAPNSVNTYMQNLIAMLRWAKGQDWGVKLYLRDLIPGRRAQVKRRGYQPEELTVLFAALAQFKESEPTKFWIPALALFSGARAGELCQLYKADVRSIEGISYFDFTVFDPDTGVRLEDKSVKTDASERQLPLHSEIIAAGFLDFVEKTKTDRLFPDLLSGPKDDYAHNFSKWFGRFKKRVGFHQPSLVFHSFRHGFRDACRDVGISDDLAQALGGWATQNVASDYGTRGRVRFLHREMEKISFGEFRLATMLEGVTRATGA